KSRVVILQDNGVPAVLQLREDGKNTLKEFPDWKDSYGLIVGPPAVGKKNAQRAWLLSAQGIGIMGPEDSQPRKVVPLPRELRLAAEKTILAADKQGLWVGTPEGLWYLRGALGAQAPRPGHEAVEPDWQTWDERDGLPSRSIEALAPLPNGD